MRSRPVVIAVIGNIVMVASLLVFVFALPPVAFIHWLCLAFVLVAEVAAFGIAVLLTAISQKLRCTLLSAGAGSALAVYTLLAVGLGFLFRLLPGMQAAVGLFIALQVALLAGLIIALVLALHFSIASAQREEKTARTLSGLRDVIARLEVLSVHLDEPHDKTLQSAADSLRHTDLATEAPDDWQLERHVLALEEMQSQGTYTVEDAAPLVELIEKLARQRQVQLAAQKHGGF